MRLLRVILIGQIVNIKTLIKLRYFDPGGASSSRNIAQKSTKSLSVKCRLRVNVRLGTKGLRGKYSSSRLKSEDIFLHSSQILG